MKKFRVGLIGTVVISDIYIKTCQKFDILDVMACGSLDVEESTRKAEKYHMTSEKRKGLRALVIICHLKPARGIST
jgi:hypothetical protein